VVVHKYILTLQATVLQSIQVSGQQLVGRIILDVKQDGAISVLIAKEGYDPQQGARSLKQAVEMRIEDELVGKYLEEEGMIEDMQEMTRYTVDISRAGMICIFKTAG
jgi:ATP-dependent Clp protease ATP-binding subunit ClpA